MRITVSFAVWFVFVLHAFNIYVYVLLIVLVYIVAQTPL
jgi:hypothetical protein